jgi:hypothetical protein
MISLIMNPPIKHGEKETMKKRERNGDTTSAKWALRALMMPLAVYATAACDTSVTNPGPVQDAFLDSLNAHSAIVSGAKRDFSRALDQLAYWSAAMTYEINPAGSTGSFGIPTYIQDGRFDINISNDWNRTSRARFVAEDALRRFEEVLPLIDGAPSFDSYGPAAEAALLAGYANRAFGENFCQVVFDGGPAQPHTDALARAEGYFTQAISIANGAGEADLATAAQAGRASVRAGLATYGLANWTDAASDASAVPNDFSHVIGYSNAEQAQGNYVMVASPGTGTYRAHTQWGTYYEDYYRTTSDPRVPWVSNANLPFGDAAVTKFGGNVIFYPQDKYDNPAAPINLSTGWEMRLIEAEAALQAGGAGADAAAALMNQRLTDLGLATIPAGQTVADVYTALKGQRMLELWIEARRMFDLRRWEDNNVSGGISDVLDGIYGTSTANVAGVGDETPVGVLDQTLTTLATNERCWPIGRSEYNTNTNL